MRVRWFGESWGAPICEPEYRVETPVGRKCLYCSKEVGESDRGVVTMCSPDIWGHFSLTTTLTDQDLRKPPPHVEDMMGTLVTYSACAYHLKCFLEQVVGGDVDSAPEVKNRMKNVVPKPVAETDVKEKGFSDPVLPAEDAEPGRGWRK